MREERHLLRSRLCRGLYIKYITFGIETLRNKDEPIYV